MAKSKSKARKLTPIIRLAVMCEDADSNSQFGRGVANLCLGVRELGSLNAAAKGMKMAYSKAWRIIKETEAALGMQLLDRDGAHGSTLTDEGNKLLDAYLEIDAKLQKVAEDEFAKKFK
ncbi:MAG: LysR family transcriptional regulator [Eggerthellaceae bacterium]|nr:LysR family transcriptional regulator [Eggerthellaceae bacterium]